MVKHSLVTAATVSCLFLHIYPPLSTVLSRSFSDHHLRHSGWLNCELSKRENIRDGPLLPKRKTIPRKYSSGKKEFFSLHHYKQDI